MGTFSLFIAMLASLAVLIYTTYFKILKIRTVFKTLTSLLFLAIAYSAHKECKTNKTTTYYKLMFLGLTFSLFGDVLLAFNAITPSLFIFGVASFALAHIFYASSFFQFGGLRVLDIIWTVIFATPLILALTLIEWLDLRGMLPVLVFYSILISFMVSKSFTLWRYRQENKYFVFITIAGALLFLISDSILLFALFGSEETNFKLEALNNFIYYIGQALFGLSFRKELIVHKSK